MSFSYSREEIGEGIFLTTVTDKKFKSNVIKVTFVVPCEGDKVCENALLSTLLITSNRKIKSRKKLSKTLAGLYGSSLSASYGSAGDYQTCTVSVGFMGDKYTLDGEKISVEAVRQLLLCIFSPDMTENGFNQSYFNTRKQELIDNISAQVNDKRTYAIYKARSIIFDGEPAGVNSEGSIEYAEKIKNKDLVSAYNRLLTSARIEIMAGGDGNFQQAVDMIKKAFGKIHRENTVKVNYISPSPVKNEIACETEEMEVAQSKMVMGFKTDFKDIYTAKLFTVMLGGCPFSKLFANVREKLSLCYYCSAGYNDKKQTLLIDSGVETENIEKAKESIIQQIDALKNGDFTDEEFENAKRYMIGTFKSVCDSVYDLSGWCSTQITRNTSYTPNEVCEIIEKITREQIVECAESFHPDSIYVMKAKEGKQ